MCRDAQFVVRYCGDNSVYAHGHPFMVDVYELLHVIAQYALAPRRYRVQFDD